jgi:hypothetical protein
MENWKQVLANSGIKREKIRRKAQKAMAEYDDLEQTMNEAKDELSVTQDEAEKTAIQNDIKEIEDDLAIYNTKIIEAIKADVELLAKRREAAVKSGLGKNRKKGNGDNGAAAVAAPNNQEPTAEPEPIVAAADGGVVDDDDKKKKSGFSVTEIVVGGIVGAVAIGLGLNYVFPDFVSKLFKRK